MVADFISGSFHRLLHGRVFPWYVFPITYHKARSVLEPGGLDDSSRGFCSFPNSSKHPPLHLPITTAFATSAPSSCHGQQDGCLDWNLDWNLDFTPLLQPQQSTRPSIASIDLPINTLPLWEPLLVSILHPSPHTQCHRGH